MALSKIPNYLQDDLTTAQIPAGTPIQIQYQTFTTEVKTSTGNVWYDTGFYVNITPQYANSKIWVNVSTVASWAPSVSLCVLDIRRYSGATYQATSPHTGTMNLDGGTMGIYGGSGGSVDNGVPATVEWFDSPNTTNVLTYRLYYRGNGNGLTAVGTCAHSNASTYSIVTTVKATEIRQ